MVTRYHVAKIFGVLVFLMSKTKTNQKSQNDQVFFVFSNIILNSVPFCHKTLSIRLHSMGNYTTEPTPVDNFCVQWSKSIDFQRNITQDSFGNISPCIIDVYVYTHNVKGSGKEEIAVGKLDLATIVKSKLKSFSLPLSSKILESHLSFDIEMRGAFNNTDLNSDEMGDQEPKLPNIIVSTKKSWFAYPQSQDHIEADACMLANLSMNNPPKGSLKD